MDKPKKRKEEKPVEAIFWKLEDGRIAEMLFDKNAEPKETFAIYNPANGAIDYANYFIDRSKNIFPYPNDDLILKGSVLLPTKADEYESESELFESVRKFIHKYLGVGAAHERLISLYVPFTWIYDCFTVLPYLRAIGDFGTGKSRYLKVIGSICYKPLTIVAAVGVAPLFRSIQRYQGTLVLDEANFKDSEVTAAIMQILNAGYEKGSPVIRCQEKNFSKIIASQVYGPKILSSRSKWKDHALESRCISWESEHSDRLQKMGEDRKPEEVPLYLDESFDQEALALRNKLLMFRFRYYGPKIIDPKRLRHPVEPRISQILLPLSNMTNDPQILENINQLAKEMNKQRADDRSVQIEARILQAIHDLDEGMGRKLYFKEICEKFNADLMDGDKKMTPQSLSFYLRKPELRIPVQKKDEIGRPIICEPERMQKLYVKFGIIDDGLTTDGSDEHMRSPIELSGEPNSNDII